MWRFILLAEQNGFFSRLNLANHSIARTRIVELWIGYSWRQDSSKFYAHFKVKQRIDILATDVNLLFSVRRCLHVYIADKALINEEWQAFDSSILFLSLIFPLSLTIHPFHHDSLILQCEHSPLRYPVDL